MGSNMIQIDGSKDVCIGPDGKLLVNGIRPLAPKVEENTGYLTFEVRSDKNPAQSETRYVHVEVFRHFGGISDLPKLDPEDVEFVDTESRSCRVHNLRLSDEAGERVFSGKETGDRRQESPKSRGAAGDGDATLAGPSDSARSLSDGPKRKTQAEKVAYAKAKRNARRHRLLVKAGAEVLKHGEDPGVFTVGEVEIDVAAVNEAGKDEFKAFLARVEEAAKVAAVVEGAEEDFSELEPDDLEPAETGDGGPGTEDPEASGRGGDLSESSDEDSGSPDESGESDSEPVDDSGVDGGEHTPESDKSDSVPSQEGSDTEPADGEEVEDDDTPPSDESEDSPQGEKDSGAEPEPGADEAEQKVFRAVKGGGGYFDIIDPDTGESVLDVFNDGKKPQGKAKLEAVAEKAGIEVRIAE